jgi:5-methylcytosine-specific restriction protein B
MQISATALLPYPERKVADISVTEKIDHLWAASKKFLVLSGPPGTGKTRAAEDYVYEVHKRALAIVSIEECRISHLFPEFRTKVYTDIEVMDTLKARNIPFVWDLAVLHPQYSYEDLIRGFRAEPSAGAGGVTLVVREGLLGFAARVTAKLEILNHGKSTLPLCVLVLDEINRAPIGQLFGEAIYALDRRGASVVTPYPLDGVGSTFSVPTSLLVLGTMNSIDRATSGFDFALRRRFANIPLLSSREPVKLTWAGPASEPSYGLILFDQLRELIETARTEGNVPASELILGHSYFLPPDACKNFKDKLNWLYISYVYQILPTLLDYQEQGLLEYQEALLVKLPLGQKLDPSKCSAIPLDAGIESFKLNLTPNDSSL